MAVLSSRESTEHQSRPPRTGAQACMRSAEASEMGLALQYPSPVCQRISEAQMNFDKDLRMLGVDVVLPDKAPGVRTLSRRAPQFSRAHRMTVTNWMARGTNCGSQELALPVT